MSSHPKTYLNRVLGEKLRDKVLMDLTVCAVQVHLIRVDGRALESQPRCVRVLQELAAGLPSLASHCL